MAASPHVNDIGTVITITIKDQDETVIDISTSSSKVLEVRAPDGTIDEWSIAYATDGTDGTVVHVSQSGELHTAGTYTGQITVTIGTATWKTDLFYFDVEPNL